MMNAKGSFFSLKWKIAVLIGGIFLILHSLFTYLIYLDTTDKFTAARQNIVAHNITIARAHTSDSF